VPTTLSGSEFTNSAGSLDVRKKLKVGFSKVDMSGQIIVADPQLSLHNSRKLWYSICDTILSTRDRKFLRARGNPYIRANTWPAVRLFFSSSPSHHAKSARSRCERLSSQEAVWLANAGTVSRSEGASHGISYLLGSIGGAPTATLPA